MKTESSVCILFRGGRNQILCCTIQGGIVYCLNCSRRKITTLLLVIRVPRLPQRFMILPWRQNQLSLYILIYFEREGARRLCAVFYKGNCLLSKLFEKENSNSTLPQRFMILPQRHNHLCIIAIYFVFKQHPNSLQAHRHQNFHKLTSPHYTEIWRCSVLPFISPFFTLSLTPWSVFVSLPLLGPQYRLDAKMAPSDLLYQPSSFIRIREQLRDAQERMDRHRQMLDRYLPESGADTGDVVSSIRRKMADMERRDPV